MSRFTAEEAVSVLRKYDYAITHGRIVDTESRVCCAVGARILEKIGDKSDSEVNRSLMNAYESAYESGTSGMGIMSVITGDSPRYIEGLNSGFEHPWSKPILDDEFNEGWHDGRAILAATLEES